MTENGKIARYELDTVFGKQVEIQARKVRDGYRPEWSFDGDKWDCLLRVSHTADDAILKARCGAFIAQVHKNAVKRRKVQ